MSKKKATPPQASVPLRCTYITPTGRRCRMAIMPGQSRSEDHTPYCTFHARQNHQILDSESVSQEILGPFDDFRSACAINRALGKLFVVTTQNRIPVRNSAVLAYIGQLLLQTLDPVRSEVIKAGGKHGLDAIARDVCAWLEKDLKKDRPAPTPAPKVDPNASWRERVEESLEVLRCAGFAVPAELLSKQEKADEEDEGTNEEDDQEEADDDNEHSDEAQAQA
jgi:hypothetical protein